MTSKKKHEISRHIIERRWHMTKWHEIAHEFSFTPCILQQIRLSKEYEHQVYAAYGRAPHCFNRHKLYEDAIDSLQKFFGIPKRLAIQVLGKDWKEPQIKATQLQINLIGK